MNVQSYGLRILGGHNLTKQAQNIVQTVRSLADLLQDHRAAYVQTHGGGTARQMGEAERDQVRHPVMLNT